MRHWLIIQKVNSAIEYNHAIHDMSMKEKASQRWPMCSKIWSCHKSSTKRPRYKHDSHDQVFANPSKEEVTNPLTVKEIVDAFNADAKLKHLFKCNATQDKGLELQISEVKNCT